MLNSNNFPGSDRTGSKKICPHISFYHDWDPKWIIMCHARAARNQQHMEALDTQEHSFSYIRLCAETESSPQAAETKAWVPCSPLAA